MRDRYNIRHLGIGMWYTFLRYLFLNLSGDLLDLFAREVFADNEKLVTAEMRAEDVFTLLDFFQDIGQHNDTFITDLMAVVVINGFEKVNINVADRERGSIVASLFKYFLKITVQAKTVCQSRQLIDFGLLAQHSFFPERVGQKVDSHGQLPHFIVRGGFERFVWNISFFKER